MLPLRAQWMLCRGMWLLCLLLLGLLGVEGLSPVSHHLGRCVRNFAVSGSRFGGSLDREGAPPATTAISGSQMGTVIQYTPDI